MLIDKTLLVSQKESREVVYEYFSISHSALHKIKQITPILPHSQPAAPGPRNSKFKKTHFTIRKILQIGYNLEDFTP
jgi:hypothetical protein